MVKIKRKNKFNPYEELGISQDATKDEITKAYKKLALKYHPDKYKEEDGHQKFLNIKKAYNILSDESLRRRYDTFGITEESELQENHNAMMQENMIKTKLKEIIKINVDIKNLIEGTKKELNLKRDIILNNNQIIKEPLHIILDLNLYTPINKPIIYENKGKKMNNICGDLYIILKIKFNNIYKLEKNTLNLVYLCNINYVNTLTGLNFNLPYFNIGVYFDEIIKNEFKYVIKNKGLSIDKNDENINTDLIIKFKINYPVLTNAQIEKISDIFHHSNFIDKNNLKIIEESNIEELYLDEYENSNINCGDIGGFPIPGFDFSPFDFFSSMNDFDFRHQGHANVKECRTQ